MFNFDSFKKKKSKPPAESKKLVSDAAMRTHVPNTDRITQQEVPADDVQDDLATKIVREIQKSTTELNIKAQSETKPSFFNSNNLRKSVRGLNNKNVVKEPEKHVANVEPKYPSAAPTETVQIQQNLKEKPSLFNMRSSSRERKSQRPKSETTTENQTMLPDKKTQNGLGGLFKSRSKSQERQQKNKTNADDAAMRTHEVEPPPQSSSEDTK